jgi:hypothetical protein
LLISSRLINKHGHHRQFLKPLCQMNRNLVGSINGRSTITNYCLWQPCLLMDRDKINNLYRGPSIDASCQVSVHLAKGFRRRRLKCEKLTDAKWWQKLTLPLERWANKMWCSRVRVMVFNATFNYIMAVSFIGGENQSTKENHRLVASHWQTGSHNYKS